MATWLIGLMHVIDNFAFEVEVILGLQSTIPDGWPGTGKLGLEPATAHLELGLGQRLAIKSHRKVFQIKM